MQVFRRGVLLYKVISAPSSPIATDLHHRTNVSFTLVYPTKLTETTSYADFPVLSSWSVLLDESGSSVNNFKALSLFGDRTAYRDLYPVWVLERNLQAQFSALCHPL